MATASDIIAALGGTSAVARELELSPSTVSSWKAGARIPKWRMPSIRSLAERQGVDLETVADTNTHTAPTATPSSGKGDDFTAAQQSEAA
ncbi:carph-isopro domain-containing protein [Sphingobium sp. C100]|uniref:carph-isopro domain-containing protein n=1 Tax=Sphingobium sp. C100 TaxID=1207055 RepID=UPI00126940A1|nr:hypothetical protein [Sphingobium sp. C100]